MMIVIAPVLAFFFFVTPTSLHAFQVSRAVPQRPTLSALGMAEQQSTNEKPACFERAVECAEHYGRCDVDELLSLAEGERILYLKETSAFLVKEAARRATLLFFVLLSFHASLLNVQSSRLLKVAL